MKRLMAIATVAVLGLSACSGGGGSSSSNDGLITGKAIPTEISAIPSNNGDTVVSKTRGLAVRLNALAKANRLSKTASLPDDSDYMKTSTRKYVQEHALEQFSIIETIMKAVAQTNYADADNINAGPYKAMIAWEDNQGGVDIKTLEPWVVDSTMITVDGQEVNRVQAWIEEMGESGPRVVKADFDIYTSATQNADGTYADYGEWDLTAKFNSDGSEFFSASARIVSGQTVLKINSHQTHENQGQTLSEDIKAVMYRSGTTGYGKVEYPNWSCDMDGCSIGTLSATYAYNGDYVAVDDGSGSGAVYKDRNAKTSMTQRYGLFYASTGTDANGKAIAAGDNLTKHKSFGFPVRYVDSDGFTQHAYYGAWQGRHSLWANGGSVPEGTTVTREDHAPNQSADSYTVSASLNGTLTKRTLSDASLGDIQNIPFETFVNKFMNLRWNSSGSAWKACAGFMDWDWNTNPPTPVCRDMNGNALSMSAFTDFGSLVVQATDRKSVNINRWDMNLQTSVDYVYLNDTNSTDVTGYSVPGFYEATRPNGSWQLAPVEPAVLYTPADGDMINVNIGGSIYIQYTGDFSNSGTGWVQKMLESFDQQTWTPTFDDSGDAAFTPDIGREYYIHNNGANFVVNRIGQNGDATDYEVLIELQSAANPSTAENFLPAGTSYLANPWNKAAHYTLDTTVSDDNFMMLVYSNDDPSTPDDDTGSVLTSGQWGLQAFDGDGAPLDAAGEVVTVNSYGIPTGSTRPVQFNWEYSDPNSGNNWGSQQFLVDGDGAYKLLSDPVQLNPITVNDKNLALQFDGWMHGLPDLFNKLSQNNWVMTQDIADKIINIPEDTLVTDSDDIQYYILPLEISEFLSIVTSPDEGKVFPDMTTANSVDLTSGLPAYVEYNMGDVPTKSNGDPLDVKYSEGNPVE